jgi:hypothetical protein
MSANRNARAQQVVTAATLVGRCVAKASALLHTSLHMLHALPGVRRDGWLSMRDHDLEPAYVLSVGPSSRRSRFRTGGIPWPSAPPTRVPEFI